MSTSARRSPTARPPPPPDAGSRDHVGVHRQVDGRFYVGASPLVGRLSGTTLLEVADLAETFGSGRVRTTVEQKLVVLDVPEDRVDGLVAELAARNLVTQPSPFRRGMLACTGIEFCKLAIVETKARAHGLDGGARAPAARLRHTDQHQRQRLPERLRPDPARRHRPQGRDPRRRGGVPGAPRRPPRPRRRRFGRKLRGLKVAGRRPGRLHRAPAAGVPGEGGPRASPSPPGCTAPTTRLLT